MVKKTDQKPKTSGKADKPSQSMRDLAKSGKTAKKPGRVRFFGSKNQNSGKASSGKAGKFFSKFGWIFPKFLRNAFAEIRQVTWPNRRDTIRLSIAVFIFAAIFASIVSLLDLGLDKLFREFIIKV